MIARSPRHGFTLIELLLAVALSAAVLMLVGAAINLYLLECNSDRLEVEEAQLARATLNLIANDLRGAVFYDPQETRSLRRSIRNAIRSAEQGGGGSGRGGRGGNNGGDGGGGTGGGGGQGGGGGGGNNGGGDDSSGSGSQSSSESTSSTETTEPPRPGIYGTLYEVLIDTARLPKPREWGAPALAAAEAAQSGQPAGLLGDVRTVRWFIRQGSEVPSGSFAALGPDERARAGGLVRQEINRTARLALEEGGGSAFDDTSGQLVAPEVQNIELRYFSGEEIVESWDAATAGGIPLAVEIRLWIRPLDPDRAAAGDQASLYTLTVALPRGGPWSESSSSSSGSSTSTSTSSFGP